MSDLTLGEKIRRIRKSLKLNQADFAHKLGFKSATAISKFEDNSREPDKNKLIEISKMGNISLDELLTGVDPIQSVEDGPMKAPEQSTPVIQDAYQSEFRVSDALTMAARVLDSKTSYATALYLNIQHFDRAIAAEERISIVEKQQADIEARNLDFEKKMQTQIDNLQKEINRLKATYEGPDGADGHLANTDKKAM